MAENTSLDPSALSPDAADLLPGSNDGSREPTPAAVGAFELKSGARATVATSIKHLRVNTSPVNNQSGPTEATPETVTEVVWRTPTLGGVVVGSAYYEVDKDSFSLGGQPTDPQPRQMTRQKSAEGEFVMIDEEYSVDHDADGESESLDNGTRMPSLKAFGFQQSNSGSFKINVGTPRYVSRCEEAKQGGRLPRKCSGADLDSPTSRSASNSECEDYPPITPAQREYVLGNRKNPYSSTDTLLDVPTPILRGASPQASTASNLEAVSEETTTTRSATPESPQPSLSNSKITWSQRAGFGALIGGGVAVGLGTVFACTAQGTLWGAAIGSAVPGIGNAVGAAVGFVGGTVWGILALSGVAGALTGAAVPSVKPLLTRGYQSAKRGYRNVKQGIRDGVSWAGDRIEDMREARRLRNLDWSQPIHERGVCGTTQFNAEVQALMNESAMTEQQYRDKHPGAELSPFDENHVFHTFADDVGRMNISVSDGFRVKYIGEVKNREVVDKEDTFMDDLDNELSETLDDAPRVYKQASTLSSRSMSRNQWSKYHGRARNKMIEGMKDLPEMFGGGAEGERATEIITSCMHQAVFADVVTLLGKPSNQKDLNGRSIPNPFGVGVMPIVDSTNEVSIKDERAALEKRIEVLEGVSGEARYELIALKNRLAELSRTIPSLHVAATETPGVFRFTADFCKTASRVIINYGEPRKPLLMKTDPSQTQIAVKVQGTINTNKEKDYITLTDGFPVISLDVVRSIHQLASQMGVLSESQSESPG